MVSPISFSEKTFDIFDPSFFTKLYMQEYSFGSNPQFFISWTLNVMEIYGSLLLPIGLALSPVLSRFPNENPAIDKETPL